MELKVSGAKRLDVLDLECSDFPDTPIESRDIETVQVKKENPEVFLTDEQHKLGFQLAITGANPILFFRDEKINEGNIEGILDLFPNPEKRKLMVGAFWRGLSVSRKYLNGAASALKLGATLLKFLEEGELRDEILQWVLTTLANRAADPNIINFAPHVLDAVSHALGLMGLFDQMPLPLKFEGNVPITRRNQIRAADLALQRTQDPEVRESIIKAIEDYCMTTASSDLQKWAAMTQKIAGALPEGSVEQERVLAILNDY